MSSASARPRYSYAEYLALEALAPTKHEFLDGQIYAMAGGTPQHAALAAAVITLLGRSTRCRVFSSDLRVRILATGLSTYPHVTLVCGEVQGTPEDPDAVVNPTVVVEITSNSTESYDRGEKLRHYQQVPSMEVVLLVSHRERRVLVHRRTPNGWAADEHAAGASLDVMGTALEVDEIYDRAQA